MKKNKFLVFVLSALMIFSAACGDSEGGGDISAPDSAASIEKPGNHRTVTKSGRKIWAERDQYVVLSDSPSEQTELVALEFIDLFKKATDISLGLLNESEVTADASAYYYYIGNTAALDRLGVDHSYAVLGDSGVLIKTAGNADYMTGATEKGIVYSVYEYLNCVFGYEYYASDEIYIADGTDADRLVFDYVYRPTIANPCMMAGECYSEDDYYKYRFQNYYSTWMAKNNDVYYAHTYFKILPKSLYEKAHPDWYSPLGNNLCLTRDPALIDQFVENCKAVIETDDVHTYFMLGQEDNFDFCNCESCTARAEELGGFASAVMMEFTNEVVRRMNAWLEEEYPDRTVIFVTFAYNETKKPPVTYNEKTKKYEPVSESVRAEKNLSVQYVINMCDYYEPYTASKNIVSMLDGWSAISDNLTIWEYSTNFNNYMDCFDNWNSMAENIRLLASHGVDYIVEQAAYNTCTSAFSEMRLYLWSKLMWDASLDSEKLIDDFIFYYYKDASDDIMKYFRALYAHVDMLVAENGVRVRSGGNECMVKKYWPYSKLDELKGYINDAYAAIEPIKASNLLRYNRLHDRIEKQELWVDYYVYKFYPIYLSDADAYYRDWKIRARKYGITMTQEGEYV